MICVYLLAHIFIKFEQCNKKNIEHFLANIEHLIGTTPSFN